MVRPADYPPPHTPDDAIAEPTDPPGERIDVGALDRGRRPRRPRLRDQARSAREESAGARRAARRGADRGARQGLEAGSAPALRSGRQPDLAARPVRGPSHDRRHAVLRPGGEGVASTSSHGAAHGASRRRRRCATTAITWRRSLRSGAGWRRRPKRWAWRCCPRRRRTSSSSRTAELSACAPATVAAAATGSRSHASSPAPTSPRR